MEGRAPPLRREAGATEPLQTAAAGGHDLGLAVEVCGPVPTARRAVSTPVLRARGAPLIPGEPWVTLRPARMEKPGREEGVDPASPRPAS